VHRKPTTWRIAFLKSRANSSQHKNIMIKHFFEKSEKAATDDAFL